MSVERRRGSGAWIIAFAAVCLALAAHGARGARTYLSASQMEAGSNLAATDWLFQNTGESEVEDVH